MMTFFRVLGLACRAMHAWPDASPVDVVTASFAAVAQESDELPAETLIAIAQHESDWRPDAVSWVADGRRHDSPPETLPTRWSGRVVCGYLQAMGTRDSCTTWIREDGGMRAGADELREWLGTCRGDLRCALRGHAGGTACSRSESSCAPSALVFAQVFYTRAVALGMARVRVVASRRWLGGTRSSMIRSCALNTSAPSCAVSDM